MLCCEEKIPNPIKLVERYDSIGDEMARNVGNNDSDDFRINSCNKNMDTNLKILLN